MRKDVRMGFAVGGVLLAVIIVAVLVMHRNKNQNNAVAFDPGKSSTADSSGGEQSPVDVAPNAGGRKTSESPAPAPAGPHDQAKAASGAAAQGSGSDDDRWNRLFVSTADDPIKAELSARNSRPKVERSADTRSQKQTDGDVQDDSRPPSAVGAALDAKADAPAPSARAAGSRSLSDAARTHKVQLGETFVTIARAAYGDGKYFKALEKANPNVNPRSMKPGTVIQLPPESDVKQSSRQSSKSPSLAPSTRPALSGDGTTYTVQKDDNLYKIAHKFFPNRKDAADELYALNKSVIGPDSTKLKPGMVLKLPARPAMTASR